MLTTVGTAILATVGIVKTDVSVLSGNVTVPVIVKGCALLKLFAGMAVMLVGCIVDSVTFGRLVGNGWTGGRPSVAKVVMTEPVVAGRPIVPSVIVGLCVGGSDETVTGESSLRWKKEFSHIRKAFFGP